MTYVVTFDTGTGVRKMRVKNCESRLHAGYKLMDYICRKEETTPRLISCTEDIPGFEIFKDIFK